MSHRSIVHDLVTSISARKVAEVGVWKGELSFSLLNKCSFIDRYWLIDPLKASLVRFKSKDGLHPRCMPLGVYVNRMGEKVKNQRQLNKIAISIESKCSATNGRAVFLRKSSLEASNSFDDGSLDFVFIDAIHLYEHVLEDIRVWYPKVRVGGILAGDDFTSKFPGVMKAVSRFFYGKEFCIDRPVWWCVK